MASGNGKKHHMFHEATPALLRVSLPLSKTKLISLVSLLPFRISCKSSKWVAVELASMSFRKPGLQLFTFASNNSRLCKTLKNLTTFFFFVHLRMFYILSDSQQRTWWIWSIDSLHYCINILRPIKNVHFTLRFGQDQFCFYFTSDFIHTSWNLLRRMKGIARRLGRDTKR